MALGRALEALTPRFPHLQIYAHLFSKACADKEWNLARSIAERIVQALDDDHRQ